MSFDNIDIFIFVFIGIFIGLILGSILKDCPGFSETCTITMCEHNRDCVTLGTGEYDDVIDDFKDCQDKPDFNCILSCYKE